MRKNSDHPNVANGKNPPDALPWSDHMLSRRPSADASVLGRAGLLRHPALGRGALPVAALIVGTYAVDDRYVIVQAFPIGKEPRQYADVQLIDSDPGVTNEPVVWLVI